jgi:hypothetical protein
MNRCEPTGAFAIGRLLPILFCDYCESTEAVEPQYDPWGYFHNYQCERCLDAAQEGSGEDAFERGMCAKYPVINS